MNARRWLTLASKALHRPPRYVAARAWTEALRQARRPWGWLRPALLTDRSLLRATGQPSIDALWERVSASPFFLHWQDREAWAARFAQAFPAERNTVIEQAERVLRHEFDLLGSGPVVLGSPLPWHHDFKSGRQWPLSYAPDIDYNELDQPSDVKVPWELSRCQHFPRLGQAYWLTGDERFAEEFVAEVTDWIESNPWTRGVNWACTMDVALRAVSWIWGLHFFSGSAACRSTEFRSALLRALFLHGEFVTANLELSDVNGNHYLCDGVGLVFLGVFFCGTAAGRRWRKTGCDIVFSEISSQVWRDGVDFEQSIAYHRLVLEGFLTSYLLLQHAGERIPPECWDRLERMHGFAGAYIKPDGLAPLIGDADDGRIQALGVQPVRDHRYLASTGTVLFGRGELRTAAGCCRDETFWLLGPDALDRFEQMTPAPPASVGYPDSGFYVLRGDDAHLIADCGEVGMRGRGGHGHNDVLGFELFLNGINVVTDCGAYLYTASREWRNRFRSTSYHNVLQVDGEELNRFIHPDDLWRLKYDAVPQVCVWNVTDTTVVLQAEHSGYERLSDPVTPRRTFALDRRGKFALVRDHVYGRGEHRLKWRFHLDPGLLVERRGADWLLSCDDGRVWLLPVSSTSYGPVGTLETGWVSASYGVKEKTNVVTFTWAGRLPVEFACVFAADQLDETTRRALLGLLESVG